MPTWDEITPGLERTTRSLRPTCTNVILGAHILGFLVSGFLPFVFGTSVDFLKFNAHDAIDRFWLWQFVTYTLVQDINFLSTIFALFAGYSIYQQGNELEQEMGRPKYLALYFSCVAYGALLHAVFQYVGRSHVGALSIFVPWFAILVASASRYPSRPVLFFGAIPMKMWTMVLLFGGLLLLFCIFQFQSGASPLSIFGAGLTAFVFHKIDPRLDQLGEWLAGRRERTKMIEGVELRYQVDQILEKISREGMGALTRTERRILKRASEATERERGPRND